MPDWLPQEAWLEFKKMRIKIKKPMTEYAERLAIKKLDKFRILGQDIEEVLDYSTFNSYAGLYEQEIKSAKIVSLADRRWATER